MRSPKAKSFDSLFHNFSILIWGFLLLSGEHLLIQQKTGHNDDEPKISLILKKTSEYCRRLENAALDFVCLEEIHEKIDLSRDFVSQLSTSPERIYHSERVIMPDRWVENRYLYDFQFTRRDNKVKEQRILLQENGRKKNEPNAELRTQVFHFENILFGPIWLLKKEYQKFYEYNIIKEELLNGLRTIVILAESKEPFETKIHSGKIWLSVDNFGILKIEWKPQSFGNYQTIEKRAERYRAQPAIKSISEYGFEKNGIYFPSRDYTEEAYVTKKGKKFIRSKTAVTYSNYKFFTVETEVIY